MAHLSYKEFMEEVRIRLSTLSTEDSKNVILNWASSEHPSKRQEFLDKLIPPVQKEQEITNAESLMDEIDAFAQRVKDGEYCDGWGWDDDIHEERDWGDESWAEEIDEFFLEARYLLLQGECQLAEDAYRKLFAILEMGEEPGYLPGDPDTSQMLKVDIDEQVALFLRSVYMNATVKERPVVLYESLNEYSYLTREMNLKAIIHASDSSLPDFDSFLAPWIEFLKNQPRFRGSELLREAVWLQGGVPALSKFAREYADKYPLAYVDWITALEKEEDIHAVIQVAREGLSRIPREYAVRAEVAEAISRAGEKLSDLNLRLEGYKESFYSKPTMEYLLDLYITSIKCGCFGEIRDEAEARMTELQGKGRAPVSNFHSREHDPSIFSKSVLFNALLLGGRYDKVFKMCKGKGPLGWSSGENPKPLFVTFMMVVLSKEGAHSKVIFKQWEDAISYTCYGAGEDYIKKYQMIMGNISVNIQLTEEEEAFYLKWCQDGIGRRIDAIVSNQYRGSYYKAAGLLVAMAETLANRQEKQKGKQFIERYRSKYPRHRAFQKEVTEAVQMSGLFV